MGVYFQVSGDPLKDLSPNVNPGGNPKNGRASLMKKSRLKGEWKKKAFLAWEAGGSPRFQEPIEITFHIFRGRRLDPDNALAGLKALIDGLTSRAMQRAGMIPDDSANWVSYAPPRFQTGDRFKYKPFVVVEVNLQRSHPE